jgi:hypothetical protein|eukprot:SAG25_NODE_1826_length_2288_cov_1.428049_3_plen_79_part_00
MMMNGGDDNDDAAADDVDHMVMMTMITMALNVHLGLCRTAGAPGHSAASGPSTIVSPNRGVVSRGRGEDPHVDGNAAT